MSHRRISTTEDVARPPTSSSSTTTSSFPNVQLPSSTDPPSPSNPAKQAVWLVFGASGHMGRSVTNAAISHGDKVSAVGQSPTDSLTTMQDWFPSHSETYHAQTCDVRIRDSVEAAFSHALLRFGDIDIIAICHGYGLIGACEDQDEYEIRNQFETNFVGTLNIIQTSLPHFREREAGRYLIFSSTSGALGVPGLGPYCATKYAIEGLVESMLYEVDQFNVKVTLVIAGHMRRDDHALLASPGLTRAEAHTASGKKFQHFRILRPSAPYASPDAPASHALRMLQWIGDNQPTSAVKAAELTWQLGHCSYPPLRLLLGTFAVESIRDRLKSIIEEIEDWKELHFPPIEGMEIDPAAEEKSATANDDEQQDGEDVATGTSETKGRSSIVAVDDKPRSPLY